MKGHTKEICYKIVGYPNDNKFRKKHNTQTATNVAVEQTAPAECMPIPTPVAQTFTPEQYQQNLQLLNSKPTEVKANAADLESGNITCLMTSLNQGDWIIDSGASNHMTSTIDLLSNITSLDSSSSVHLSNGNLAKITHTGSANILKNCRISDVLHVPHFKYNLLSVSKLTKELQCLAAFFPDLCVLGIGSEANEMYILRSCLHKMQSPTPTVNTIAMQTSTQNKQSSTNLRIWHQRLGHMPMEAIKKIGKLKQHFTKEGSETICFDCSVCPLAKQTRLPFHVSTSRTKCPFELLHADVWGPYRVPTYDNKRFFLTIVDDYSRSTWLFLMNTKDETCWLMKRLISMIHTQFNWSVKTIRTDNGSEFVNSNVRHFLEPQGIIHQTTCVYTPQQNSVVERRHRYVLEVARVLRFQAVIPLKFWGECVLTAVHIINRLPSTVQKGKSPYEKLLNTEPSLDHLKVFGCLCYAVNVRRRRTSSQPKLYLQCS